MYKINSRYPIIKEQTKRLYSELTKQEHYSKSEALYQCSEVLKSKNNNFTTTDIAIRDTAREFYYDPYDFRSRLKGLETNPEIDVLVRKVKEKESLLKKTLKLRNFLIENNRINAGNVTPKLKGFEKFCLKFKYLMKL